VWRRKPRIFILKHWKEEFLVRFRIDGLLRDIVALPKSIHAAIVARIKILSMLKIDEHRIPQDGRFKFQLKGSFIALRCFYSPGFLWGEYCVAYIWQNLPDRCHFEELGLTGHNLDLVKKKYRETSRDDFGNWTTGSGKRPHCIAF